MKNLEKQIQKEGVNLTELSLEEQKSYNGGGRGNPKQKDIWDIISKYFFQ